MVDLWEKAQSQTRLKACGTIYLEVPEGADDHTEIVCSTCGGYIGRWGELQADLRRQINSGPGVFDLHEGQFEEKK